MLQLVFESAWRSPDTVPASAPKTRTMPGRHYPGSSLLSVISTGFRLLGPKGVTLTVIQEQRWKLGSQIISATVRRIWPKVTALTGLSALGSELRVRSGFGNSGWVSHSTPAAGRAGRIVTWISSQPGMAWTLCRLQLPRLGRCLDDATRAGHCDCLLVLDSVSWAPTVPSLALAQISPKGCPHEPRCFGSEAAETPDEGTLNGGR